MSDVSDVANGAMAALKLGNWLYNQATKADKKFLIVSVNSTTLEKVVNNVRCFLTKIHITFQTHGFFTDERYEVHICLMYHGKGS
jgi:hypothetical protein